MTRDDSQVSKVKRFGQEFVGVWVDLFKAVLPMLGFAVAIFSLTFIGMIPLLIGTYVQFGIRSDGYGWNALDPIWLVAEVVWLAIMFTSMLALGRMQFND